MRFPQQYSGGFISTLTKKRKNSIIVFLTIIASCSILAILSPASIPESVRRQLELFEPKMVMVISPVPPIPTWTLSNGMKYPIVASNTASLSAEQTEAMVLKSISLGITNIDVHLGGTERDGVASVLQRIHRDEIFLVTKIDKPPADLTDPEAAAQLVRDTVDAEFPLLGVETVDVLLLKDSASCAVMQAQWAVLEHLLAEGRTRAIGTYNYCRFSIDCVLETAATPPALNYIMRHVGMGPDDTNLIRYGESKGIRTVAYGTLGEPVALEELLTDPTMVEIAMRHGRSVEEVALRWNIQSGFAVSNRPSADYAPDNTPDMMICHGPDMDCEASLMGMRKSFTWELSRAEMAMLDGVRLEKWSQSPTYYSSAGCENSFGVVDHPTASSCGVVDAEWCGNLSFLKDTDYVVSGVREAAEMENGGSKSSEDRV